MDEQRIYPYQLFSLIFVFELGSAVLFALGIQAKQDIWIVVIFSYLGSVIMAFIYTRLYYKYKCDLVEYLIKIWGRYVGSVISTVYIIYFFILAAIVTRNFLELLKTAILKNTPSSIIVLMGVGLIAYAIALGIECVVRVSVVYVPIIAIILIVQYLLFFYSGLVDFSSILPVLENGIIVPLKVAYRITLGFPFTEIIAFTTIYPMLAKPKKAFKMTFLALTAASVVISLNDIFIVSILGVNETARASFPLYVVVTMIKLGLLENLDAIAVIILVLNGFFKVYVFYYAGVESLKKLFKFEDCKFLLVPISVFIVAFALFYGRNYTEHIELGLRLVIPYVQLPLQVFIPIVTFIASWFRSPSIYGK
ncbi:GerAB/ArcD/ProY family transporter [Caldanaerobius polysaccharolyticus]|uniref:GerAB/ArcD/ProY family transporter n=1 Tax=Caldanaerobius polysaccharolyticus TaxID=44256 RepID=UPI00047E7FF8|nr:GerAB/ArcD/ProY family transporter [Caldanaerobius polysaccharolyticus]